MYTVSCYKIIIYYLCSVLGWIKIFPFFSFSPCSNVFRPFSACFCYTCCFLLCFSPIRCLPISLVCLLSSFYFHSNEGKKMCCFGRVYLLLNVKWVKYLLLINDGKIYSHLQSFILLFIIFFVLLCFSLANANNHNFQLKLFFIRRRYYGSSM